MQSNKLRNLQKQHQNASIPGFLFRNHNAGCIAMRESPRPNISAMLLPAAVFKVEDAPALATW